MTGEVKLVLLFVSCLLLMGLGFSALLVSNAHKQRQKRDARFQAAVTPHVRTQQLEVSAFIRPRDPKDQSLIGIAGRVFNFDPANLDRYPMPWWIVVCISLVFGKLGEFLLGDLLGRATILIIPVGCVGLSRLFFGTIDSRWREKMLTQFPDALAMIVRSVRVGIPVQEAIRAVARESPHPTGPEFTRLVSQISVGVATEDAMLEMAQRAGLPEYRFFATALSLQNQTGGALSEMLENLAEVIRKRVALKAKAHALSSEAKASACILGALPVVTGLALWVLNPNYISMLFTDKTGQALFGSAVVSLVVGMLVIRTIINRSLPT
jgi:tight adherence protein B